MLTAGAFFILVGIVAIGGFAAYSRHMFKTGDKEIGVLAAIGVLAGIGIALLGYYMLCQVPLFLEANWPMIHFP